MQTVNVTYVYRACFEGDVRSLQDALSSGTCSADELSEQLDSHGLTLLHVAAMRDNTECVGALLEAGFNVKVKSSAGWLPYQEAAGYRCYIPSPLLHSRSSHVLVRLLLIGTKNRMSIDLTCI